MKCAWHDSNMVDSSAEYDNEFKIHILVPPVRITLGQWFPKCAPRIPRDPWIHFCNGYFEVDVLLKISTGLL